jgi:hypothetical protein
MMKTFLHAALLAGSAAIALSATAAPNGKSQASRDLHAHVNLLRKRMKEAASPMSCCITPTKIILTKLPREHGIGETHNLPT